MITVSIVAINFKAIIKFKNYKSGSFKESESLILNKTFRCYKNWRTSELRILARIRFLAENKHKFSTFSPFLVTAVSGSFFI